jgi:hypothetical protein
MCLFAALYTLGVVLGIVPKDQKIDAANPINIALAGICAILLVNPDALERLRHFKVAGFVFDLEQIRKQQEQQAGQLEAINLLLPMVVREEEGRHLHNIAAGKTSGYLGNHDMRTELRRLKTMGLIEKLPGRFAGEMKDGMKFDLAH